MEPNETRVRAWVRFLQYLRLLYGKGVNDFIKAAVGILLILVSTLLLLQRRTNRNVRQRRHDYLDWRVLS